MDWLDYLRGRRDTCREAIASIESGQVTSGTREAGGEWIDTTADSLASFKDELEVVETILANHGQLEG